MQSSWTCAQLWLKGFADQALRSVESHLVAARASDHPYSLFSGLLQTACPIALFVGDLTLAERYVKALMDLSARHALELWNLGGRFFGGVLLIKRGNIGAGLELLRTAFARGPPRLRTLSVVAARQPKGSRSSTRRWRDRTLTRNAGASPSSCASKANSGRVRRRPRRRPRSTFCARSIGRAGRAPCHGSCEHPQALHACSRIKAGWSRRADFCGRCTIASVRVVELPT